MKSINLKQKYPHIIDSYACNLQICYNIFSSYKISNLIWNMFNSKAIKVSYIIIINIQSNPMSSY